MDLGAGRDLVVVADQLGDFGGTERVLKAVLDRYPEATLLAPAFDTTNVPPGARPPWTPGRLRLVHVGGEKRHLLAPLYARRFRREAADAPVVLALTHMGWGLAARLRAGARLVCYTAGLPKALFGETAPYLREYPRTARPVLAAAVPLLRAHHRRLMRRPDRVVTNSAWSAGRVRRETGRRVEVVHPPVRTAYFTPAPAERGHALLVARLVPHKRVEQVVEAFYRLGTPLVVAGGGRMLAQLRASAPSNVRFTGYVGDDVLRDLYRSATTLVCPSVEEFGIVMAESLACGTPVIGLRAGGALEIVRDGETGILLDRVDAPSLAGAMRALAARPPSPDACRASVLAFAEERFVSRLAAVLEEEAAAAAQLPATAAARMASTRPTVAPAPRARAAARPASLALAHADRSASDAVASSHAAGLS